MFKDCRTSTSLNHSKWHVDSGATMHMAPHKTVLANQMTLPVPRIVRSASGEDMKASIAGEAKISKKLTLKNTLMYPV